MAETPTIHWSGESGKTYKYWIHPLNTTFLAKPGNYIFSKKNASSKWVAIYVGQTQDLSSRFTNHHQEECVDGQGATHIHVHTNESGKQARLDEETDIRCNYNPHCNGQ